MGKESRQTSRLFSFAGVPRPHASTPIEDACHYDRCMADRSEAIGEADLAAVGALFADPARAKVLLALADGRSLAASVLAAEAGVAPSTASHHLARLVEGRLVTVTSRGRYRYYALAGPQVGELIEAIARVAPTQSITSLRQGTRAHAIRYGRRCYDHLAGRLGVAVADALCSEGALAGGATDFVVTETGVATLGSLGVEATAGTVVRGCVDWTEQRPHVAGPLGRTLLARLLELAWVRCDDRTRAVRLTDAGRVGLPARLGLQPP
jgi:DNA-binding transcriptional ArsR family regulator